MPHRREGKNVRDQIAFRNIFKGVRDEEGARRVLEKKDETRRGEEGGKLDDTPKKGKEK